MVQRRALLASRAGRPALAGGGAEWATVAGQRRSQLSSWRESPELFVLYTGTDSMHAVPKRWFPDPERVAELRSLLERLPLQRLS